MTWKVDVIEYYTGNIIKTLEVQSERAAERVENGLNINLNHNLFFTRVVNSDAESNPS